MLLLLQQGATARCSSCRISPAYLTATPTRGPSGWWPILQNFTKLGEFLCQNDSFMASLAQWMRKKKNPFFFFFFFSTKSIEPIFQSAGPILRHTALEGTLTPTCSSHSSTELYEIHTLRVHYAHAAANLNSGYSKYAKVARVHYFCTIALRTSRAVLTRAWASRRVDLRERKVDSFSKRVIIFCW